jgi:hypothetical protein
LVEILRRVGTPGLGTKENSDIEEAAVLGITLEEVVGSTAKKVPGRPRNPFAIVRPEA